MKQNHLNNKDKISSRMSLLIYHERKNKKKSQQELCQQLGITQGLLSKIENQKLAPSVHVWLQFCELFGVRPEIVTDQAKFLKKMASVKKQPKQKH